MSIGLLYISRHFLSRWDSASPEGLWSTDPVWCPVSKFDVAILSQMTYFQFTLINTWKKILSLGLQPCQFFSIFVIFCRFFVSYNDQYCRNSWPTLRWSSFSQAWQAVELRRNKGVCVWENIVMSKTRFWQLSRVPIKTSKKLGLQTNKWLRNEGWGF